MKIDPFNAIAQLDFAIDTANLLPSQKQKLKENLQALAQVVNEWNKLKKDEDNGISK